MLEESRAARRARIETSETVKNEDGSKVARRARIELVSLEIDEQASRGARGLKLVRYIAVRIVNRSRARAATAMP
jgi:hypothetical protein